MVNRLLSNRRVVDVMPQSRPKPLGSPSVPVGCTSRGLLHGYDQCRLAGAHQAPSGLGQPTFSSVFLHQPRPPLVKQPPNHCFSMNYSQKQSALGGSKLGPHQLVTLAPQLARLFDDRGNLSYKVTTNMKQAAPFTGKPGQCRVPHQEMVSILRRIPAIQSLETLN